MARKVLLFCSILSSLLYVATLVVAPMLWEDYSSASQTVSEIMAIGAPSRPLVVSLLLTYDVLVIAFGLGVWGSAGGKHALRVVGGVLVAYGVVDGVRTARLDDGEGIHGNLSKSKVSVGCLGFTMSAPVHSLHTMVCTQALGQGRENCVGVAPTR